MSNVETVILCMIMATSIMAIINSTIQIRRMNRRLEASNITYKHRILIINRISDVADYDERRKLFLYYDAVPYSAHTDAIVNGVEPFSLYSPEIQALIYGKEAQSFENYGTKDISSSSLR